MNDEKQTFHPGPIARNWLANRTQGNTINDVSLQYLSETLYCTWCVTPTFKSADISTLMHEKSNTV